MRKNINIDSDSIAVLDRIKKQTGANHSESIRRAITFYGNMKRTHSAGVPIKRK